MINGPKLGLRSGGLRDVTPYSVARDADHWYDAEQIDATDGDPVNTWSDVGGGGADLTDNGNPPTYTANVQNGKPVVRFSSDALSGSTPAYSTPYNFFVSASVRNQSDGDKQTIFDGASATEARFMNGWQNSGEWDLNQGTQVHNTSGDSNWHVFRVKWAGTDTAWLDQSTVASGDAGNSDLNGITLGVDGGGSFYGPIDVGEVVFYNGDMDAAKVNEVEQYLADKWGVTL